MTREPLTLQQLEDRTTPVTWGNPWPDATHLTASFVADGVQAETRVTDLFATLDQQALTQAWQTEILRGLQSWAIHGNVNVGLVADGGQMLGAAGRPQGDSRFGDIRISGFEMPEDVIAITNPFSVTGGTTSGDIRFNTTTLFSLDGSDNSVQLFAATLHEAGHSYGLPGTEDPTSATFEHYQGPSHGLSDGDVAAFQELYGARQADQYEGSGGNDRLSTATQLSLLSSSSGTSLVATGDITTLNDADVYSFRTPLSVGPIQIHLKVEGLSLLTSKVTVFDSRGRIIASRGVENPLGNDIDLEISNPRALSTYYVKVESNSGDVFGIGSYQLEIESLPVVNSLLSWGTSTVSQVSEPLLNNDLHLNDSFLTATLLPSTLSETSSSFDHAFRGSIHDSWDVDFYRIQASQSVDSSNVMTVMAWGLGESNLRPQVSVYDAQHNLMSTDVLVNADGFYSLQVRDVEAGASYFVKLDADTVGNYFLGVDFSDKAIELTEVSQGVLDSSTPTASTTLELEQTQQIHFLLDAEAVGSGAATVSMTVLDQNGNVVATLTADSEQGAVSSTMRLGVGTYTIRFQGESKDGSPLEVNYDLKATRQSDPIGPQPEDPTEDPEQQTMTPPPSEPAPEPQPEPTTTPAPDSSSDSTTQSDPTPEPAPEPEPTSDPAPEPDAPADDSTASPDQDPAPASYQTDESSYYYYQEDQRGLNPEDPYDDPYAPY